MNSYVSFAIGVACAGGGGELFVRGLVGGARWARISPGIIGTTVAAFATSSPEISVAIGASTSGQPEISLGDSLGSNVVNVALILGIALCMSPIASPRDRVKRDFSVALLVPIIVGLLGLDGMLSRLDGALLLVLFFTWLYFVTAEARRERSAAGAVLGEQRINRAVVELLIGFVLLVGSGHFIVTGARGIAMAYGIPEFVIGATVVALGTSMPELATAVISKMRGHDEIGLGTILGSNIFNGLFIVGIAASICPIRVDRTVVAAALVGGLVATALSIPNRGGVIGRSRGVCLLTLYAVYIFFILER